MSENTKNVLEMKNIEKGFGGVTVLHGVDFSVREGEIHALMGENGAGKSTLIKILTGVYPKDGGQICIDGKEVDIRSRQDAIDNKVSVIYQELSLIPTLSVAENIFLGQEVAKAGFLKKKEMMKEAQEMIDRYNFKLKAGELVGNLSVAKQQTVEILKALHTEARIMIMDEPTASLNAQESEELFEIIRDLKAKGTSIIYISHRLEEVYAMSDRLTVLRNGEAVAVLDHDEITPDKVVRLMLGKTTASVDSDHHEAIEGGDVLQVDHLTLPGVLHDVSFEAYAGQILGIGGLVGAGRTEILESIFGLRTNYSGTISLNGQKVPKSCKKALKMGIGLVPEDRRLEGLVMPQTIRENVALSNYDVICGDGPFMSPGKVRKAVDQSIIDFEIKPSNPELKCMNLSGGNQQKVVLAKWLQRDLKVLMVDEPTVGIDVGTKSEIYNIMRRMADSGAIVLVVSSDTEELVTVSDRVIVLLKGEIFMDAPNVNLTADDLILASSGMKKEAENE